jgi:hypothetical protein
VPQRDPERLAREHDSGEASAITRHPLDFAVEERVDGDAARDPVTAETVEDRLVEAGLGGERGIGVQRILVAGEPVDQRLLGQDRVLAITIASTWSRRDALA